jgi:hypothetical protein
VRALDPGGAQIEDQGVWKKAAPAETRELADSALVSLLEDLHCGHSAPPFGIALGVLQDFEGVIDRGVIQAPGGQELIPRH